MATRFPNDRSARHSSELARLATWRGWCLLLLAGLLLSACQSSGSTFVESLPGATSTPCSWNNHKEGPGSLQTKRQFESLLASAGINATLNATTQGSHDKCHGVYATSVHFELTLNDEDLIDPEVALEESTLAGAMIWSIVLQTDSGLPRQGSIAADIKGCAWQSSPRSESAYNEASIALLAEVDARDAQIYLMPMNYESCTTLLPALIVIAIALKVDPPANSPFFEETAEQVEALVIPLLPPARPDREIQLVISTPDGRYCLWYRWAQTCR